jgi:outer membrane protein assembly factor BamA
MNARLGIALALLRPAAVDAQAPPAPRGWEVSGLPALNFNADEGFGYGLILHAFNYGSAGVKPYAYTIQPQVFLTTKGRRDVSVFFDAPHLLPHGWRWGAYVGREQQLATPYYGIGNSAPYDSTNERPPNPYYYRFGRVGIRFNTDLQRSIKGPLRLLVGTGFRTSKIDQTPFDSGTTLLRTQTGGSAIPDGRSVYGRVGLVYDTRDRETGPTRGQWIEALAQRGGKVLGGTHAFTRLTATARGYISLGDRLVWAQRVTAQNLVGTVPFYELFTLQGSFKDDEGIGGGGTVRGLPKNRFTGKGVLFANEELRWRAAEFSVRRRSSALVLSGFVDGGRVWDRGLSTDGLLSDLHFGFGGGARLRYGENFVVALDVGHSKESKAPIYIGMGYLF